MLVGNEDRSMYLDFPQPSAMSLTDGGDSISNKEDLGNPGYTRIYTWRHVPGPNPGIPYAILGTLEMSGCSCQRLRIRTGRIPGLKRVAD